MPVGRAVLGGKRHIAAGVRDRAVTIEQKSELTGGGFPGDEWTTLTETVYMSRVDLRADERYASAQDSAFTETQWQGPYDPNMDPEVIDVAAQRRLVYRGRIYNIRSASIMERRLGIEYMTLAAV